MVASPGLVHTRALAMALPLLDTDRLEQWGRHLALRLAAGARLLVAGNGGSAAQAQHLTSELVGRFDAERVPLSAIALHADSSAVTAIVNDYGAREVFARQVHAHGRPGDVLLLISTSGRSPNVLAAAAAGRELGLTTWALTGPGPTAGPGMPGGVHRRGQRRPRPGVPLGHRPSAVLRPRTSKAAVPETLWSCPGYRTIRGPSNLLCARSSVGVGVLG